MASRPERPASLIRRTSRFLLPFAAILIASTAFTWASRMSHGRENRSLREREQRLQEEIAVLEEEVRVLRFRVDGMENDPYVVESQIRERFGYLRPGEQVVRSAPERPHR